MTSHREILERLDEYVDGALPSEETRRIDEHLHGCARCRQELNRLGRLLDEATALRTRPILPGRDLWPGITERLAPVAESREPANEWRRLLSWIPRGFTRRPLAWSAAAVLVAACLAVFVFRGQQAQPGAGLAPASAAQVPGLRTLETETAQARSDYEAALKQSGGPEPANAGSDFQKSLGLLDQAIADSRAAVEKDPRNQSLQKSLLAIYQKQLSLLRWATRIIEQT
jgi:anti-sigma-K factor RskA